jgi:glycyl-tRNA synthetase
VYDDSGSIGRRYARQDEVGTPFCVTVDFDTIGEGDNPDLKHTVTVRERDSGRQHRVLVTALLPWLRERIEPLLPI